MNSRRGGDTFALCGLSLAVDLVSAAGGLRTAPGALGASVFFMLGCLLPVHFCFFCLFPAGFFCWGPAVFFYSSSDAGGEPSFDCILGGSLPRASRRQPSGFIEMASVVVGW